MSVMIGFTDERVAYLIADRNYTPNNPPYFCVDGLYASAVIFGAAEVIYPCAF